MPAPVAATLRAGHGGGERPVGGRWPDGDHGAIIVWLPRRCFQVRPELDLHVEQGVDPGGGLLVVEVTSYDQDADTCDPVEKPLAYAEAGLPVWLLIDRTTCETVIHSEPEDGEYRAVRSHPYGSTSGP
ncbi:Uma2 family endonuclease [Streptomyces sp. 184]|uniref:Uma2 family endonuclease n=1 Tax=Streptomyces sp. 184 TaxID=1827526 RepID=UPI003891D415